MPPNAKSTLKPPSVVLSAGAKSPATLSKPRWQADEEDWRSLKLVGRYRGRKLAALSLGLNPAAGVRKRLVEQPALLGQYKGLLSLLRNRASSTGEVGTLRFVTGSENDPLRHQPARSASDRVFNLIDFVDFMRGRIEIDQRMVDIADELRGHPDWVSAANPGRETELSPKQRSAQTMKDKSMARVLLGVLVARCGLEITFPWRDAATVPKYKLKRGAWPDIIKAVSEAGLKRDDGDSVESLMHPKTVRAAVSNALLLLGEGVVRKAIEGRTKAPS